MYYRKVKETEYDLLAKIHLQAFSTFFLTTLGYNFLRTYYKASLQNNDAIAVCAVDENKNLIGFGIGCIHSKGYHMKLLLKNLPEFFIQAIIISLTKTKAIFRLISNLDKNSNDIDDGNYAELLSIAVLPTHRGLGVGKELIKRYEQEAIKRGCKKIALTTDFSNNEQVISFYKKTGYNIFYEFTTYPKRKMYKLIKEINN